MTSPRHLAIIGGGAAGTLLALAVLRKPPRIEITLIDPNR